MMPSTSVTHTSYGGKSPIPTPLYYTPSIHLHFFQLIEDFSRWICSLWRRAFPMRILHHFPEIHVTNQFWWIDSTAENVLVVNKVNGASKTHRRALLSEITHIRTLVVLPFPSYSRVKMYLCIQKVKRIIVVVGGEISHTKQTHSM